MSVNKHTNFIRNEQSQVDLYLNRFCSNDDDDGDNIDDESSRGIEHLKSHGKIY